MDFSDKATQHEEMMRDISLRNAANPPPELPPTGTCYWCDASVPEGHRFCDCDCRNDFQRWAKRG